MFMGQYLMSNKHGTNKKHNGGGCYAHAKISNAFNFCLS